jgi:hypothetical protein
MLQPIDAVYGKILRRCERLLISRSTWPVLSVYMTEIDPAEWHLHGRLISWPGMPLFAARTHLGRHRVEYAKLQLKEIGLLVLLKRGYVNQPPVYELVPGFVAPRQYWRTLDGVPLATPLERDAERGIGLDGEGAMMNELGAKARLLARAHYKDE